MDAAIQFLNSIGIATTSSPGATGFLPGVKISGGALFVDPSCHISDLLHEAGHVAIFPATYRHLMSGNISNAQRAMFDDLRKRDIDPDSQIYRAAIQSSDPEATAWAWAAGVHLGVEQDEIVLSHQYEGDGESIRLGLALGLYIGIHGLAHAGFCSVNRMTAAYTGKPLYPKLAMWTQSS